MEVARNGNFFGMNKQDINDLLLQNPEIMNLIMKKDFIIVFDIYFNLSVDEYKPGSTITHNGCSHHHHDWS